MTTTYLEPTQLPQRPKMPVAGLVFAIFCLGLVGGFFLIIAPQIGNAYCGTSSFKSYRANFSYSTADGHYQAIMQSGTPGRLDFYQQGKLTKSYSSRDLNPAFDQTPYCAGRWLDSSEFNSASGILEIRPNFGTRFKFSIYTGERFSPTFAEYLLDLWLVLLVSAIILLVLLLILGLSYRVRSRRLLAVFP